ncbi:Rz1-like lysis system protein LysC [Erwinia amylovora]
MHREKSGVNRYARQVKTIRALTLWSLLLSVTACGTAPRLPQVKIVQQPVQPSLTAATPTPQLATPVTWGAVAIWSDRLRDALDTCNADKAAIADIERQRFKRLTDHTRADP